LKDIFLQSHIDRHFGLPHKKNVEIGSTLDSYKLIPAFGAFGPTPKPQSGLFVYGVKLKDQHKGHFRKKLK
jgi:hypothetical protein